MSEPATVSDVEDLQLIVIILGGAAAVLSVISIIVVVVSLVCISRLSKKLKDINFVSKNTRLDVRKVIEILETAVKRNPALLIDEEDGSEQVSPIFTRQIFTPSPLPFVLRESEEYDRRRGRTNTNNPYSRGGHAISSNSRNVKGPPVPPRRSHSFYGDY